MGGYGGAPPDMPRGGRGGGDRGPRGGDRGGNGNGGSGEGVTEFSIYVGDLDPHVTDQHLFDHFMRKYRSVLNANIITDPQTKRSKRYGFVRFSDY